MFNFIKIKYKLIFFTVIYLNKCIILYDILGQGLQALILDGDTADFPEGPLFSSQNRSVKLK